MATECQLPFTDDDEKMLQEAEERETVIPECFQKLDLTPDQEAQRISQLDRQIKEATREDKSVSDIEAEIRRMTADPADTFAEEIREDQPIKIVFDPSEFESQEQLDQFKRELAENPDSVLLVDHTTAYDHRVRSGAAKHDPDWIQYHAPMPTAKNMKREIEGYSPKDNKGEPFIGHHRRREATGPIWEMKEETHQEHSKQLHDFTPKKGVNRPQWNEQRKEYRKSWAKDYLGPYWTEVVKSINIEEQPQQEEK